MNITADTNLLVRVIVRDDPQQTKVANNILADASLIAITSTCFCELMWVLVSRYKIPPADSLLAVETLLNVQNVVTNRLAIENGIAVQTSGGNFADGVIAYEGRHLGGETFMSFDKKAVSLLKQLGHDARMPS